MQKTWGIYITLCYIVLYFNSSKISLASMLTFMLCMKENWIPEHQDLVLWKEYFQNKAKIKKNFVFNWKNKKNSKKLKSVIKNRFVGRYAFTFLY